MKKYLVLICFILFGSMLHSQVLISLLLGDKLNSPDLEFGLEGGINWSLIDGMETNKALSKFNLGFYFDIRVKNEFFLYTGVLVKSSMGVNKLTAGDLSMLNATTYAEDGVYSQVTKSFIVPVLGKHKFKNNIYVEFGPQFSLVHKAHIEFNSSSDNNEARIREYNRDLLNRIDAGLLGGAGFKFKKGTGMSLGLKYYYGFVDAYKAIAGSNNSALFLKFNFPIGAKQKTDKKSATPK